MKWQQNEISTDVLLASYNKKNTFFMNLKEGKGVAFDYLEQYGAVFIVGTMKDSACAEEMKMAAEKYKDVKDLFDKIETDTPCGAQCGKGYLFYVPTNNQNLTVESMIKEATCILSEIGIHNLVVKVFDGAQSDSVKKALESRESLEDVLFVG